MYMRMRERHNSKLSPFEILFAHPPYVGLNPETRAHPSSTLCENDMLQYCKSLSTAVSQISQQVKAALPSPAETTLHPFKPGDWVIVRELRPKHWKSRKWNGSFQVLLTTHTAVKVAERATWIHATHCKKVPEPEDNFSTAVHDAHRRAKASREPGSQSEEKTH
ncbi:hypothetical protein Q5P01_010604 [Channa striata]|uniref:Murine leukemia virus integrase C-terminal domain-containing protein n=1 Tax=Channa striata TaxID=64152 RepID=A0AA88MRZ6_CHASR|nr:hypothetical protein Q5P01_010604 [Channa striata]